MRRGEDEDGRTTGRWTEQSREEVCVCVCAVQGEADVDEGLWGLLPCAEKLDWAVLERVGMYWGTTISQC